MTGEVPLLLDKMWDEKLQLEIVGLLGGKTLPVDSGEANSIIKQLKRQGLLNRDKKSKAELFRELTNGGGRPESHFSTKWLKQKTSG